MKKQKKKNKNKPKRRRMPIEETRRSQTVKASSKNVPTHITNRPNNVGQTTIENGDRDLLIALIIDKLKSNSFKEALKIANDILIEFPSNVEALNLSGVAAFQLGIIEEALKKLKAAAIIAPDNPAVQTNLGNVLTSTGRHKDADKVYRKAMSINPPYADAYFNFGVLMEHQERYGAALNAHRKATNINSDHTLAWQALGNLSNKMGLYKDARNAYEEALKLEPNSADTHTNLAAVLTEQGLLEEAEDKCRRAIVLDPELIEAKYNLGTVLQESGNYVDAIEIYKEVLSLDSRHAAAAMNIAYGMQQLGKLEEADEAFKKTINLDPEFAQAYTNYADLQLQRGEPETALQICDGFLDRHPGDTSVLAYKSVVLRDLGDDVGAENLISFDRFLESKWLQLPEKYKTIDEFNIALTEHVKFHPSLSYAPQSHATRQAEHSGELMEGVKGPIEDLEAQIWKAISIYENCKIIEPIHPFIVAKPEKKKLSIWGVVMKESGHQIPHIHPAAWLSGVYYPEVPEVIYQQKDTTEGFLIFGTVPEHFNNIKCAKTRSIRPRPGMLVLFPSYYYHHTNQFSADGSRTSIAFDVLPG
ncbi:MAG: tetratricopeptide repeat protein [Pseudomonadota bacterium]|nr:tetratricopeptide repeat protein [Pseudomonadota bacterium]